MGSGKTNGSEGFALVETMVALLLLAIAMLGAVAAVVQSLAGQRAALLQSQAADLAGNLAEALRSAPDQATAQAEIDLWQSSVRRVLPVSLASATPRISGGPAASGLPSGVDIQLQWRDGRTPSPSQLSLPVSIDASGSGP